MLTPLGARGTNILHRQTGSRYEHMSTDAQSLGKVTVRGTSDPDGGALGRNTGSKTSLDNTCIVHCEETATGDTRAGAQALHTVTVVDGSTTGRAGVG